MAEEKIRIIIDGDSRGVVNAANTAESSISKLGGTLKNLAIAGGALILAKKSFELLSGAVKGTIDFLKNCINEAANSELQLTKLNQALKSTGNFTVSTSKNLQNYAAALQKTTMYEDDAIVSVEAMLATFKLTEEEIKIATDATLDLAAATGQDLQSAAILMGKAMVGETGTLSRYGIIVDEAKLKSDGWRAVIEEINTEFGGQAAAQADTYTGKMEQLKNVFGDMRESIGNAFLPVLTKLLDKMTSEGGTLEKFGGWIETAADGVGRFLENNWDSIEGAVDTIFGVIGNILTTTEEVMALLSGEGYEDLTLGEKISKAWQTIILPAIQEKINESWQKIGTWFDENHDVVFGWGEKAGGIISEGIIAVLKVFGLDLGEDVDASSMGYAFGTGFIEGVKDSFANINFMELVFKAFGLHEAEGTWADLTPKLDDESIRKKLSDLGFNVERFEEISSNLELKIIDNSDEIIGNTSEMQNAINNLQGTNITSTHTIITDFITNGGAGGSSWLGNATSELRQSGGELFANKYISDLGIYGRKGEGIIPEPLMRAIKEGKGSYAGIPAETSSGDINIQITGPISVRNDSDISKVSQAIGREISYEIARNRRGLGYR